MVARTKTISCYNIYIGLFMRKIYLNKLIYHFFLKGHSKHSNDRAFGLIANQIKKEKSIETYSDLCRVIENSASNIKLYPVRNLITTEKLFECYQFGEYL